MFLKKSGTKSGVTFSGTQQCQSQLKKVFAVTKITTSVKRSSQVGNSRFYFILLYVLISQNLLRCFLGDTCFFVSFFYQTVLCY